ncbi:MAG TPA: hypothetical protein VEH28_05050 [Thermoplasmata archaeon]|nr:hypothetical protein [Thermoplasmata archaeon]
MDRPSRINARRVGILVIVFGLIIGAGLSGPIAGAPARADLGHSGIATATHSAISRGAVPAPLATTTSATLNVLSTLTTYTALPSEIILDLTVNNSALTVNGTTGIANNAVLWLNVTNLTGTPCGFNNITSLISAAAPTFGSTATTEIITFPLTTAYFVNDSKKCSNIAVDPVAFYVNLTVNGGVNGIAKATGFQYGSPSPGVFCYCILPTTAVVFTHPTSLLHVAPVPNSPSTYAFYANYTGQYVGRVQLSVYNPTATAVILSKNLAWNGTTPTVYDWVQTISAVYPYTLSVETGYGLFNSSGSIFVPIANYVYTNETSWTNSTLITGLSSGASGTLLLVVGLIVGMIVAIVVGRRVWGGPKPVGPAQPWTPKTEGATNQCSVCGQSFATPEELAAHSKSEHGMQ